MRRRSLLARRFAALDALEGRASVSDALLSLSVAGGAIAVHAGSSAKAADSPSTGADRAGADVMPGLDLRPGAMIAGGATSRTEEAVPTGGGVAIASAAASVSVPAALPASAASPTPPTGQAGAVSSAGQEPAGGAGASWNLGHPGPAVASTSELAGGGDPGSGVPVPDPAPGVPTGAAAGAAPQEEPPGGNDLEASGGDGGHTNGDGPVDNPGGPANDQDPMLVAIEGTAPGNNSSDEQPPDCGCDVSTDPQKGQTNVSLPGNGQPYCTAPRPGNVTGTNPHPIVSAQYQLPATGAAPTSFVATLTFGGIATAPVHYSTAGLSPGQTVHFALQVDASALPTGRYHWTIDIQAQFGAQAGTKQIQGDDHVVNRIDSPYGRRWWIDDLDQIVEGVGGASLIRGDASARWYPSDAGGGYAAAEGSFESLTRDGLGWRLSRPDGSRDQFSAAGLITARVDRNGNQVSYTYTDGDGDGSADELATSTDTAGRVATYAYAGGKLASMTDFYGRTTNFAYSGPLLTSATQADPDGAGPLAAPVTSYTYQANSLLSTIVDPEGRTTTLTYDSALRTQAIQRPGAAPTLYTSAVVRGLPAPGTGTAASPAAFASDGRAVVADADGTSTIAYDKFGNPTEVVDALGNVTKYDRDANGRLLQLTRPDPDGAGPLAAPVTTYAYDSRGRMTGETLPDGRSRAWTYDPATGQLTSYRDQDNRTTSYTLDAAGNRTTEVDPLLRTTTYTYDAEGKVTSVTRPDPDGPGPLVAPTTTFAYDASDRLATITLPGGSTIGYGYNAANDLVSTTDQAGRTTTYGYDALGRRTSVTRPDPDGAGPLAAPTTAMAYWADGKVKGVTDALGRVTSFAYDSAGRLQQITRPDPDGAGPLATPVSSFTYDGMNRLATEVDALGRVTAYAYDALGRPQSVTRPDPDGAGPQVAPTTAYAYDALGRPTLVTDPLGRVTTVAYDALDRVTSMTRPDPDGVGPLAAPVTAYGYDAVGRPTTVTDPLSRVTTYGYDAAGQLASVTAPPQGGAAVVTQYGYDGLGRATSTTDPLGRVTTAAYDALDRVTSVTRPDPDGVGPLAAPVTAYGYDAVDNLTTVTDPLGRVTTYAYDRLNRLTARTRPDPDGAGPEVAPTSSWDYDAVGNLVASTGPLLGVTSYAYDALDRRVAVTQPDPDGAGPLAAPVTAYAYDAVGNQTSITDPASNRTTYTYDALDRLTATVDPLSKASTVAYDAANRPTSRTDRLGRRTNYSYDALGRRTAEQWLDGVGATLRTVTYSYDAADQLTGAVDPAAALSFTYDGLGRQETAATSGPGSGQPGMVLTSEYDLAGNRTSLADDLVGTGGAGAGVTTYAYDGLDRLAGIARSLGGSSGPQVALGYDAANRLTALSRTVGGVGTAVASTMGYDALDRLTTLTHQTGTGTSLASYTYAYDPADRLTRESNAEGVATYTYDALDQLTGADRPAGQADESYSYDANGNRTMAGYATGANNRLAASPGYTYAYDDEGNLAAKAETATGNTWTYTYDHRNRMTGATESAPGGAVLAQASYTYDALDRRIRVDHQEAASAPVPGDAGFEAVSVGPYGFAYSPTGSAWGFGSGSGLTGNGSAFTWGGPAAPQGTQVAFIQYAGSFSQSVNFAAGGSYQVSFQATQRQGNNQDFQVLVDGNVVGTFQPSGASYQALATASFAVAAGSHTIEFRGLNTIGGDNTAFIDAVQIVRVGTAPLQASTTWTVYDGQHAYADFDGAGALKTRYLHGPAVDMLLARTSAAGETAWYLTDRLGSVRDIANPVGSVIDHIAYDGYGRVTDETNPGAGDRFKFTGRELDALTDMQYNRARYYDAAVGRWTQEDPIGFQAKDSNLYRYVGNRSTEFTDPSGLQSTRPLTPAQRQYVDSMLDDINDLLDIAKKRGVITSHEWEDVVAIFDPIPLDCYYAYPGDSDSMALSARGVAALYPYILLSDGFFTANLDKQIVTLLHENYHHGAGYWQGTGWIGWEPDEGSGDNKAENYGRIILQKVLKAPCMREDFADMRNRSNKLRPGIVPAPWPPPPLPPFSKPAFKDFY